LQHTPATDESSKRYRHIIWRLYCIFQYLEALCSCISVSILRRHLMVWDIYAPHFLFTVCFTMLNMAFQSIIGFFLLFRYAAVRLPNKTSKLG
jgi:hypothetical protein